MSLQVGVSTSFAFQVARMIHPSKPNAESHPLPNLIHFARLRRMGLAVSAAEIAGAAQDLAHGDLAQRDDVFHTPRCILISGIAGRERRQP